MAPFFSEEVIAGTAARRALQSLVRKGPLVTIIADRDQIERLSNVIDQVGRDPRQLELDQPTGSTGEEIVFGTGDLVQLYWSDEGMCYGARAKVVRVNRNERLPSYEIGIDGDIQRGVEQRSDTRIPVAPEDGVRARMTVTLNGTPLAPTVRDISASGARLSLPVQQVVDCDLEPKMTAFLTLSIPSPGAVVDAKSRMSIVWMERVNDQLIDFGCAWIEPSKAFNDCIERFIAAKERKLKNQRG